MIEELQDKIDSVFKDFEVLLYKAAKDEEFSKQLKEKELRLNQAKDDLKMREGDFAQEKVDISESKRYIKKKLDEIALKEKNIETEWRKITEAQSVIEELEVKENDLKQKEVQLAEKEGQLKEIDVKLSDIKRREDAIEKEKVVDRERKKLILEQEAALQHERERLQRLATRFGS